MGVHGPHNSSSCSLTPAPPCPDCLASVVSSLGTLPDTEVTLWALVAGGEVCGLWLRVRVMTEIPPGDELELQ